MPTPHNHQKVPFRGKEREQDSAMISSGQILTAWPRTARKSVKRNTAAMLLIAGWLMLFLTFAAQAAVAPQTTTTQFGSGVTTPGGALLLSGSATNPNTGQPVRFLWSSDTANGLCRLDPDADTAGPHTVNVNTCVKTVVGGLPFQPGQLVFDPNTNDIYAIDAAGKVGVFRLHFQPTADVGNGLIDFVNQEILGGSGTGRNAVGGCGIPTNVPDALALGPDSNLYVGSRRSGTILRVVSPQTEPLPCGNVQNIGSTPDARKAGGLAWIGHNLYGVDGSAPWIIQNADQCFTAANNLTACKAITILGAQVNAAASAFSDQVFPAINGSVLYFTFPNSVTRVDGVTTASPVVTPNYGGAGFQFVSAVLAELGGNIYVGDDPANGVPAGQGLWFQVTSNAGVTPGNPPANPNPPGTPTNVTAVAGDTQATVNWTPAQDGVPVTSFTVHNSFSSNGVTAPDVTVAAAPGATAPPTSATVTGLTDGVSYQFEVAATNSNGSSAFSAPSNTVTPQVTTVPDAPTGVVANAGNANAQVAWTAPANTGGAPISSYTVTALVNGVASGITATAPGNATGVQVNGLTNGTTYTFTVHATNSVGNGPESTPSNAVTPTAPVQPDTAISMTGPASVGFGANATYTLTVSNSGPATAPQVIVTDTIPASGATFVSETPSQGACLVSGSSVTCNLGAMAAGTSATVTVTLNLTAQTTNTASVQATDASGAVLPDATPNDNSASVTTALAVPQTTTDIQVVGAAQNGGPNAGATDTYTWQVHNGGNQPANAVQFVDTLPPTLTFESVTSSVGSCTAPPAGSAGGTVSCSVATIGVGQTMVVTINVVVKQAGSIANTGHGSFSGTDTNAANNSFTVTINAR